MLLLLLLFNFTLSFPSPNNPPENVIQVQNAQAALDMYSHIFPRYDLAELMLMWKHPGEHDCEEWAPSVAMEGSGMKYAWCGNSFCADIFTKDDILIDYIDIQIY